MQNRSRVIIVTGILLTGIALLLPGLRSRQVAAQRPALTGSHRFLIITAQVPNSAPGVAMSSWRGQAESNGILAPDVAE